ncbi:MAG TPA: cation diffusion facilitator family transporter [Actinomycetes bacterium]|nr:cation diffusion facilitator family transporter [Actinomycetes bacterium]
MGHSHAHTHAPSLTASHRSRLVVVLGLTLTVLVVQLVGAALSNSLALLADAGHMLTDVAGVSLALLAITLANRPASPRRTFGYYRLEILAALANAVLLIGVALWVLVEALDRLQNPPDVAAGTMLLFALVGLAANLVGIILLRGGADSSLNIKGAYLEVLGDALGSLLAASAAVVIMATGWLRADAVGSILVALLILPRAWLLVRDAVDVLLEASPKNVDLDAVRRHILDTPGVVGTHDLHVWTITSGMPVLASHVVVDDAVIAEGRSGHVLDDLTACLADHFAVEHCTFQIEPQGHAHHEAPTHH